MLNPTMNLSICSDCSESSLSCLLPKTGLHFLGRICLGQIIFCELLPQRQPSQQSSGLNLLQCLHQLPTSRCCTHSGHHSPDILPRENTSNPESGMQDFTWLCLYLFTSTPSTQSFTKSPKAGVKHPIHPPSPASCLH